MAKTRFKLVGDMNPSGFSARFQARSKIHRFTPEVIGKLGGADDAGDSGTSVKADTQLQLVT